MKSINIAIKFDEERFSALKLFLESKNTSIENEIEKFAEQLYKKVVPINVRDYISMKNEKGNIK